MDVVDQYRALVRQLTRADFVARFAHPFLLKYPVPVTSKALTPDTPPPQFSFGTRAIQGLPGPDDDLDEQGPAAAQLRVEPVRKRPDHPYPDRISIGRARNCDVVLRFMSVSKLHAYILTDEYEGQRRLQLLDVGSTNGTRLDGKLLKPNEPVAVALGATIRFGSLEVQLVDAACLYDVLTAA